MLHPSDYNTIKTNLKKVRDYYWLINQESAKAEMEARHNHYEAFIEGEQKHIRFFYGINGAKSFINQVKLINNNILSHHAKIKEWNEDVYQFNEQLLIDIKNLTEQYFEEIGWPIDKGEDFDLTIFKNINEINNNIYILKAFANVEKDWLFRNDIIINKNIDDKHYDNKSKALTFLVFKGLIFTSKDEEDNRIKLYHLNMKKLTIFQSYCSVVSSLLKPTKKK